MIQKEPFPYIYSTEGSTGVATIGTRLIDHRRNGVDVDDAATLLPATTTATMAEEADTNDNAAMESIAQNILEVRITRRRLTGGPRGSRGFNRRRG